MLPRAVLNFHTIWTGQEMPACETQIEIQAYTQVRWSKHLTLGYYGVCLLVAAKDLAAMFVVD